MHDRRLRGFLKDFKSFLEIHPKGKQIRFAAVRGGELVESPGSQPCRENLDGDAQLSGCAGEQGQPVNLLDSVISDGNTSDRNAVSMQENIATGIWLGFQDAVCGIGITDVETEIEIALWVEPIKVVKAFGNLFVAEAPFRAENAGGCADRIVLDESESARAIFGPQLQRPFFLKRSEQDCFWEDS